MSALAIAKAYQAKINNYLNKDESRGMAMGLDELPALERFSFKLISLDLASGGGIPEGRWTEIAGKEHTGKTTLALECAYSYLIKYPDRVVNYLDVELTLVPDQVRIAGLYDPAVADRFIVTKVRSLDLAYEIIDMGISTGEEMLFILDSIGGGTTELQISKGLGPDMTKGMSTGKVNADGFGSLNWPLWFSGCTVIVINQIREGVGQYKPDYTAGSSIAPYYYSFRLWLYKNNTDGLYYKVKKSKISGNSAMVLKGITTVEEDLLNVALSMGVITKKGNTYLWQGKEIIIGGVKASSKAKMLQILAEHRKVFDRIRVKATQALSTSLDITSVDGIEAIPDDDELELKENEDE